MLLLLGSFVKHLLVFPVSMHFAWSICICKYKLIGGYIWKMLCKWQWQGDESLTSHPKQGKSFMLGVFLPKLTFIRESLNQSKCSRFWWQRMPQVHKVILIKTFSISASLWLSVKHFRFHDWQIYFRIFSIHSWNKFSFFACAYTYTLTHAHTLEHVNSLSTNKAYLCSWY